MMPMGGQPGPQIPPAVLAQIAARLFGDGGQGSSVGGGVEVPRAGRPMGAGVGDMVGRDASAHRARGTLREANDLAGLYEMQQFPDPPTPDGMYERYGDQMPLGNPAPGGGSWNGYLSSPNGPSDRPMNPLQRRVARDGLELPPEIQQAISVLAERRMRAALEQNMGAMPR